MSTFFYNDFDRRRIKNLKGFAEKNRLGLERMDKIKDGRDLAVRDRPQHKIKLGDVQVVFSVEFQPSVQSWCRHVSISFISTPEKLPNHHIAEEVLKLFDFRLRRGSAKEKLSHIPCWVEKVGRKWLALDFLQPVFQEDERGEAIKRLRQRYEEAVRSVRRTKQGHTKVPVSLL